MKETPAAIVAASLVSTPVIAQAATAPAAPAPAAARAGSPVGENEDMQGGWLIPALAIIAILLGILAITSGGNDLPHSP